MDPFATLGLDASTCCSGEEVNSAFRRLALRFHPDKQCYENTTASADEFRRISAARDRALQLLAERDGCKSLGDILTMLRASASAWARKAAAQAVPEQRQQQDAQHGPGPVDWAVYIANRLVSCTRARTLQMDLDATLEDIYKGSAKRLGISVLRAQPGCEPPYSRVRQEIILPLSGDVLEHRFDRAGDDAPAALMGVLAGADAMQRRGDVVVRVRPQPHDVFSVDQIISPLDLHATVHVSLFQHYIGGRFTLPLLSGETIEVEYEGAAADDAGDIRASCERDGQYRQVKVYRGLGLPDSTRRVRGDLYVFLVLRLPKLTADDTRTDGVRAALERLSGV